MPVNVINGPKRDSLSTEGGVMKGDIDMNGNKISNVGNPTSGGDVVTKEYLENNPPNINELPGILPISKGGTEASTKRAALNNLEGMPIISSIFEQSLDEIIESFALVDLRLTENEQLHSIIQGNYAYVITLFFAAQSTSSSRMQLAIGYNTRAMAMRTYYEYDGAWSDWNEVILASGGTMTGKLNVKDLVVCDGTLYPSVDYKADFDGPVKAQVLANMERNIVYLRNWCTDTNYYENYLTPDPDIGRTANGNYSILTTKETADYVVAQGTSGGWTYRKWNSGFYDLWINKYIGKITLSKDSGYNVYYSVLTLALPSDVISTVSGNATPSTNGYCYGAISSLTNTALTYRLISATSNNPSVSILAHVLAKWK